MARRRCTANTNRGSRCVRHARKGTLCLIHDRLSKGEPAVNKRPLGMIVSRPEPGKVSFAPVEKQRVEVALEYGQLSINIKTDG